MRRRLTVAILALVAGTLLVAGVGSLVLIRRSTYSTAESQIYSEAHVLAALASDHPSEDVLHYLPLVRQLGGYRNLTVAGVTAAGVVTVGLPDTLDGAGLRPAHLLDDQAVAGVDHGLVYVLIPLSLTTLQKRALSPPVPYEDEAVLVATRRFRSPVTGLAYFVLVALAALTVATAVAYALASRFSRPLVNAVAATERIAGGDLDSRMPADAEVAEFAALATAINAMADSLGQAQRQQRQFLLSVSHDLRTPLTSIRGYADAIAEGATDDVAGAVAVIRSETARLDRLVRDLLDLARLDARRFSFDLGPVDAAATVGAVTESFRPEFAAAGLALVPDVPGPSGAPGPVVVADPDRLSQVLSNLVDNASRYARSRVVVGARPDAGGVVLWVADDGPGIAPPDLDQVFRPHFTADRAGPRRRGTGLGLAIVAELVAAMGGTVTAESPVDGATGTRISVRLPAAGGAPGAPAASGSPAASGAAADQRASGSSATSTG